MAATRLHRLVPPVVGGSDLRRATGRFATGVTVLSTLRGTSGRGMTANSFTSVSLQPPLILVCVRHDSAMRRLLDDHGGFSVSVLSAEQRHVAAWFADPARPDGRAQFDAVGWTPGDATGEPVITGSAAWIECVLHDAVEQGDHLVVFGRVLGVGADEDAEPLVFFGGGYGTLAPLAPRMAEAAGS